MGQPRIDALVGKEVIIRANGIDYAGTLLEIGVDSVTLKRKTGYASILMNRITSLKGADDPQKELLGTERFIDPSFYSAD